MANTPHLNITLVSQSQSQKEVTINAAIQILEMLQNTAVISMALSTPPGSPTEGDLYLVLATGTGAWASHDGEFAYFINGGWIFIEPFVGVTVWDINTGAFYVYTSGAFALLIDNTNPNFATLGVNSAPDATNKLTVASIAVLLKSIGTDCKLYISKTAAADAASIIFQDNFSGRAELGCIGDDDFRLKVSPDGASYVEAWVINKTTGATVFKQTLDTENANTWSKAQRWAKTVLSDAATIATNLALTNDFSVILGGNRTLGVPTNIVAGQRGTIDVRQDITGTRTLGYAWPFEFAGGTPPTLTTTKLGFDQLEYHVNHYATAAFTVTIAAPAVVTWVAHGLVSGQKVQFTTTGALPTGLAINTTYWITRIDADSFNLSTSLANAGTATFITTTGSQSGVHTAVSTSITISSKLALA